MKNQFPAKRILTPMDLSPLSKRAWEWAKLFAGRESAFEALFVYDLPTAPMLGMPYVPMPASAECKAVAWLKDACPGAAVRVAEGDPVAAIARRARRADLLVMATHGRRGIDRMLMGSVCEALARDAAAPLLTFRDAPKRKIRSVLAPMNLSLYAGKGFRLAAEAARHLGAELVLLYVAADSTRAANPNFVLNQLISELPKGTRAAVKPRIIVRAGNPVREILLESARHGLVVLTAHRKSLLNDLALGTTAERVLRFSRTAVLTAPSGR